jgi:hypothetical protein
MIYHPGYRATNNHHSMYRPIAINYGQTEAMPRRGFMMAMVLRHKIIGRG